MDKMIVKVDDEPGLSLDFSVVTTGAMLVTLSVVIGVSVGVVGTGVDVGVGDPS